MFKYLYTTLLLLGLSLPSSAHAQTQDFSIGAIIGEPTGLTAKLWLDNRTAIQGSAAWSFRQERAVHIHGDFLFHHNYSDRVSRGTLHLYYGIGGRIKDTAEARIGVRVPLGMNYQFANTPLTFFGEIAPLLDITPATEMDINAAFGLRFHL